ncbi:hypothetical protein ACMXYN_12760 [Neptuniibacter sp. PT8_73]|uniref:hypothetical protein n=1 Tax=unclassified Neptuniibacter TaxID=2630693 RepID=UPI0039F736E5
MFKRNIVSASIASILLTGSFAVSANTEKEKEEDSVESWGAWAQQFATAAGGEFNSQALAFASFGSNETGRNTQNEPSIRSNTVADEVVPDESVLSCSAGSMCGFIGFNTFEYDDGDHGSYGDYGDAEMGIITADMYENDDPAPQPRRVEGPVPNLALDFEVKGNDGFEHKGEGLPAVHYDEKYGFIVFEEGGEGEGQFIGFDKNDVGPLFYGFWSQWENTPNGQKGVNGGFIGGVTTSLAELNAFTQFNPTATYSGSTMFNGSVDLEIDFNNKSWSGNFGASNAGKDAFKVRGGKLSGIAFTATSKNLSADKGSVTGVVSGALFGSEAETAAGLIDIKKELNSGTLTRKELFAAGREGAAGAGGGGRI